MKQEKKQSICPISGQPKRRRHAVAASVWDSASTAQKANWANPQKGSLRRFVVGGGR
jgi:hypothetical protein